MGGFTDHGWLLRTFTTGLALAPKMCAQKFYLRGCRELAHRSRLLLALKPVRRRMGGIWVHSEASTIPCGKTRSRSPNQGHWFLPIYLARIQHKQRRLWPKYLQCMCCNGADLDQRQRRVGKASNRCVLRWSRCPRRTAAVPTRPPRSTSLGRTRDTRSGPSRS